MAGETLGDSGVTGYSRLSATASLLPFLPSDYLSDILQVPLDGPRYARYGDEGDTEVNPQLVPSLLILQLQ